MARKRFQKIEGAGDWSPLPDGSYDFEIDSLEDTQASTGTPQLRVNTHVLGGQYDGKKATIFMALTPKNGFRVQQLLDACGVDCEDEGAEDDEQLGEVSNLAFDGQDLIGAQFRAYVNVRHTPDGKEVNDFKNYTEIPKEEPRAPRTASRRAKPAEDDGAEEEPPRKNSRRQRQRTAL